MLESSVYQSNWNPRFFEQGGLFAVFNFWADWFLRKNDGFPSLDEINEFLATGPVAPVQSGGGFPVRCVRQQRLTKEQRHAMGWRADYQMRIFLSGEAPTRPNNWHDFFNAMSWLFLPKVKAALNARHFQCAEERLQFPWKVKGGNRTREQDLLTLLDEGGLVVATENDFLWQLICQRQWQRLFLEHADDLASQVVFIPIGHALFECALANHPRIHASTIRVRFQSSKRRVFSEGVSLSELSLIDELAALEIKRRAQMCSPDDLHALPIWGIPGWHPHSGEQTFLADRSYFR